MRILVPALIIVAALGALITGAVLTGQIPELQVADALETPPDGTVKLHGIIESIEHDRRPLRFTLRDKTDPTKTLSVVIHASRPDIFDVDKDVSVIVERNPKSGALEGDKIYTKCPSKYEATAAPMPDSDSGYGDAGKPDALGNDSTSLPTARAP